MRTVDPKYRYYLVDLGPLIRERAFEAKEARSRKDRESLDYAFEAGRIMGFLEVISIMQQQAQGFDISLDEIGLANLNPDTDLL